MMIFQKPKILDIDGPHEDVLGYYAEVHFETAAEAEKWIDTQTKKVFPRRRFLEWLFDRLRGE